MCGIAGFVGAGERGDLDAMIEVLRHRGPDALTTWSDDGRRVFLGHTRLAIIDPTGGGQPMPEGNDTFASMVNRGMYVIPWKAPENWLARLSVQSTQTVIVSGSSQYPSR